MKRRLWITVFVGSLNFPLAGLCASAGELLVHEWGTFTSISGTDGLTVQWTPYRGGAELPGFVYGGKSNAIGTIRMETPVIYFYGPKELTCTVKVSFSSGQMTEYYPMPVATSFPVRVLNWNVELLPGRAVNLPQERNSNHYYYARETDAVPLRVWKNNVIDEYEKFLFYRGVGTFPVPLSARIEEDRIIYQAGRHIEEVLFFENRDGRTSCLRYGMQSGGAVGRSLPDCSVESVKRDLRRMLVGRGLFAKEAEAMVKTWEGSWFEEGFRVFYVLPRDQTDAILSLEITPRPDKLVRVMVGRLEVTTPEDEEGILQLLTRLKRMPDTQETEISNAERRHGRFLAPMIRSVLEKQPGLWDTSLEGLLPRLGLPLHQRAAAQGVR